MGEGSDPLEAAEDALAELLRWGLVERLSNTDRCAQHPLLHTYAAALARRADEYDPALGRYTKHVIHTLAAQFDELPLQEWNTRILPDKAQIHYVGDMLAGYLQGIVLGTTPLEALAQPEPPADLPEIDPEDRMAAALLERGENFSSAITGYVLRRRVAEEGRRWLWMGLACARLHRNRGREGLFLNELALWHNNRGYPQVALAYHEAALPIDREMGNRAGEAATLNNMAGVYVSIAKIAEGRKLLEQALPIWREVGDRAGETSTLLWLADIHRRTGHPQEALELQKQVLVIQREIGNRAGEATTLHNIGLVYDNIGQPQRALEFYEQALPIQREVEDRAGEATTLNNIGGVYRATGQPGRALDYYQRALPMHREVGNRAMEAVTCFNIGMVLHRAFGRTAEAIPYLECCVQIDAEIGHPDLESDRAALEQLRRIAAGGA